LILSKSGMEWKKPCESIYLSTNTHTHYTLIHYTAKHTNT
jgi:hypothetical protein